MEKYSAGRIKSFLDESFDVTFFESIGSTNDYAKTLAQNGAKENSVVVADSQQKGRGRLDRSFLSLAGKGVYLSLILRPGFFVSEVNSVTLLAAMAVYDTILDITGVKTAIKWPNDIYLNGKKICGILTESTLKADATCDYVIVGIGVNILHGTDDFPDDLRDIATSLFSETGIRCDRAEFTATLLKNFSKYYKNFPQNKSEMLCEYSKRLFMIDEKIRVIGLDDSYEAILKGVDGNGYLIVLDDNGDEKKVIGGEISIRPCNF